MTGRRLTNNKGPSGPLFLPARKRPRDQIRVVVPRIARHLPCHPIGFLERLVLGAKFDLRHHQARIRAQKLVHFPHVRTYGNATPVLLNQRLLAQAVEQFDGIGHRNRILPLPARSPGGRTPVRPASSRRRRAPGTCVRFRRPRSVVAERQQDRLQDGRAQSGRAGAVPAHARVGQVGIVLERHFERERQAAEMVAHVLGGQRQHVFLVLAGRVAHLVLEVGRGVFIAVDERLLPGAALVAEVFQHLVAGHEVVRQRFVAVDIEEHVDARFVHLLFDDQHFGAALERGRHPLAIEVGAGRVGAQVAAHRAVRIHVGHDVEHAALQQLAGDRIGVVQQRVDQPFDEPLGHRFARVLARDEPDFFRRFGLADDDQVHVAAIDRAAQVFHAGQRMLAHFAQQAQVALVRIRLEVRVIDAVGIGRVLDGHDRAIKAGGHAEPVFAVVAGHRVVVLVALGVRRFARVQEAHPDLLARRALQAEVEPLVDVRVRVLAQLQFDGGGAVGAHHLDGARVEILADFDGHGRSNKGLPMTLFYQHGPFAFIAGMPRQGLFQHVRGLPAAGLRPLDIRAQLRAVVGMGAALDDQRRPLARGQAAQVGQAPFGHQHVDVMLGVVHVRGKRHHARDGAVLGHGFADENRQLAVAREVARAADAVHHVRAAHVGGVDVAVDVEFQRRVQGDDAEPAHDLGMVADLLRAQHDAVAVLLDVGDEALVRGGRQRDRRRRGHGQVARIEQGDRAVLQYLRIHGHGAERRRGQAMQHGVGDGADARLQRQQLRSHAPGSHFALEKSHHVAGDGVGLGIGRQRVGRAVGAVGDHDGGNARRVDRNRGGADALQRRRERDRPPFGARLRHVDVVKAFQRQRRGQVDLDDDLRGLLGEAGRVPDRHGGDDGAVGADRHRLDDRNVYRFQVAGAQLLGGLGQVLIDEHHLARVDLAAQRGVGLERHAARHHAGIGHQAVAVVAERGAREQRQVQGRRARPFHQRQRQRLGVAGAREAAHADGHAVLEQRGGARGAHHFVHQRRTADAVEHRLIHGPPLAALLRRNRTPQQFYPGGGVAARHPVDHQQDGAPAGTGSGRAAADPRRPQARAHRYRPRGVRARRGHAGVDAAPHRRGARHPDRGARPAHGGHPAHDQRAAHARTEGVSRTPSPYRAHAAGRHGPGHRAQGGRGRTGNRPDRAPRRSRAGVADGADRQLSAMGAGGPRDVPERAHHAQVQGVGQIAAGAADRRFRPHPQPARGVRRGRLRAGRGRAIGAMGLAGGDGVGRHGRGAAAGTVHPAPGCGAAGRGAAGGAGTAMAAGPRVAGRLPVARGARVAGGRDEALGVVIAGLPARADAGGGKVDVLGVVFVADAGRRQRQHVHGGAAAPARQRAHIGACCHVRRQQQRQFADHVAQPVQLALLLDVAGAARVLDLLLLVEYIENALRFGAVRVPYLHREDHGTAARFVVEHRLDGRVGVDAAVPVRFTVDAHGGKRGRQRTGRHHVIGREHIAAAVEVAHGAGAGVHGADRKARLLIIQVVVVDQVVERGVQRRGQVERRVFRAHLGVRVPPRRGIGFEKGGNALPHRDGIGHRARQRRHAQRVALHAAPELAQALEPLFRRIAGDDGAVDGANRRADHPVGLQSRFVHGLVHAQLISAQRAAALQDQDDLAHGWGGLGSKCGGTVQAILHDALQRGDCSALMPRSAFPAAAAGGTGYRLACNRLPGRAHRSGRLRLAAPAPVRRGPVRADCCRCYRPAGSSAPRRRWRLPSRHRAAGCGTGSAARSPAGAGGWSPRGRAGRHGRRTGAPAASFHGIAIEFEHAHGHQGEVRVRPYLGQIERVPAGALFPRRQFRFGGHLQTHVPAREIAGRNRAEQVALRVVRIGAGNAGRLGGRQVLDALLRLEVPLAVHALARVVDQAEGMAAETVHVAVAVRRAAVREQHRHLVQAFRRLAPEVEHHGRRLQIGLRVALLGMNKIGELDAVLDEEHRRVVTHQVPVAFLGVKAHGETARIAFGIGAALLATDGGKAHEGLGLLADVGKQFGFRKTGDVVGDGEGAVGAGTLGVHHALGNALAVEVLEFFDQVEVLQQNGATRPGGDRVLIVGDGDAGGGGDRERMTLCLRLGDTFGDMRQRILHLVDQDQAQVPFLQAAQSRVDGQEFAVDFLHVRRARRAVQARAQQRDHFAVHAAALARVFVQDHVVECAAEDFGLQRDVLVAAVAGARDHHAAALGRHGFHGLHQRQNGVRIVAVVGDHGRALVVEYIEPAGRVVGVVGKRAQAEADRVPADAHAPRGGDGRHHVIDLEADGAVAGDRHFRQGDASLVLAFGGDQVAIFHVHGAAALRQVRGDHGMAAIGAEEDHLALAGGRHGSDDRIDRVQHRVTGLRHVLHDHALEHRQIFHGGDVVQAQVIAGADVGHHGHLAAVEGQAFAQDAATGAFEDRRVHVRVQQHVAGAARAAAVAAVGLPAFDVHAVGVGHAGAQAAGREQVGDQAHGGGLAVGTGDGNDGNAAVFARREHGVDDGFAHRAALAVRWRDVHAQAGRGVDFHHAAAAVVERLQHAFAHHVHAADIEADHLRRFHRARRHFRVHIVGDVGGGAAGGQVGVVTQDHALALGRHGVRIQVLQRQARQGDVVEPDLGQRRGVAAAAPGVRVDQVHQLAHRVLAIAHHLRRVAARGGNELVADDEQAVIVARQVAFHHHVVAEFFCGAERLLQVLFRVDVDGDALALVAVLGFDHHRQADVLRRLPGVRLVFHGAAVRHRHAGCVQQLLGQFLVLGDRFADGAGAVHFGGLDAALFGTPAEHHHAAFGEAADRDIARDGGADDGAGARPQAHVFIEVAQFGQGRGQVERRIGQRGVDQLFGQRDGQAADGFFRILHHGLVDAVFQRGAGAAEGDRAAGLRLQAQGRRFQHAGQRHGGVVARVFQCADGREARMQALLETGQLRDGAFFGRARNDHLHCGVVTPEIGAAKGAGAYDFHKSACSFSDVSVMLTLGRRIEGAQSGGDQLGREAQRPAGGNRGQHGFGRHQRRQRQADHVHVALRQHDAALVALAALEHHARAVLAMLHDGGQMLVHAVENHFAVAQARHVHHLRIGGIEYRRAARQDHVDLGAQHVIQLVVGGDMELGQVCHAREVGHHAHRAAVVGQAFGEDHARARFEHRRLHVLVEQQAFTGLPVGQAVARQQAAVHKQAVLAAHAHFLAADLQQPGDQARRHGGAMRARDAHHGNAARLFGRKQLVHDGGAHVARRAVFRFQVHQQAGAGIDFDDGAALLVQRTADVGRHQVDAGNVQAHHARRQRSHGRHFRVHQVGDVGGHVAIGLDQHLLAGQRHRERVHALAFEFEDGFARLLRLDQAQWKIFFLAAARIDVDVQVAQLLDRVLAVARDPQRFAAGGSDHALADHQQAVFVADDEALDDHARAVAFVGRQRIGGRDVRCRHQVERHAAPVVAVVRLDHDRQADVLRRLPRLFRAGHQFAFGHGHAARRQQRLGQVLVAGDAFGNGAGFFRFGRPDAALRGAVAQLHQVAVGEADRWNLAVGGRIDDIAGAGAQAQGFHQVRQVGHGGVQVVRGVVDHRHQEIAAGGQRRPAHLLLAGAERHFIQAGVFADLARLAEAGFHAGHVLQFEHDVFQDVAGVGARRGRAASSTGTVPVRQYPAMPRSPGDTSRYWDRANG
uniref:Uncharacterized protein n=1 Tax=Tanacetum cinerariifolium TaxID=118510 RepID=A0A699GHU6_TANCI|nr:hypothetical protein [Tanacetum cinerariifolium]